MGQRLIKIINSIFIGSAYSIDLEGQRTSKTMKNKESGYYVSDFLKKRNHYLQDQLSYKK